MNCEDLYYGLWDKDKEDEEKRKSEGNELSYCKNCKFREVSDYVNPCFSCHDRKVNYKHQKDNNVVNPLLIEITENITRLKRNTTKHKPDGECLCHASYDYAIENVLDMLKEIYNISN